MSGTCNDYMVSTRRVSRIHCRIASSYTAQLCARCCRLIGLHSVVRSVIGAPTLSTELGDDALPVLGVIAAPLIVVDLGEHCRLPETWLSAGIVECQLDYANRCCLLCKNTMPRRANPLAHEADRAGRLSCVQSRVAVWMSVRERLVLVHE